MPINVRFLIGCALSFCATLALQADEPVANVTGDTACHCLACDCDTACHCEPPLINCQPTQWCCPGWVFTTDVLFLDRGDAPSQTLVRDQNTGNEILNTENLNFNNAGGVWYRLLYQDVCCNGWDASYFGIDGWNASATSGGPGVSPLFEGPGGIPIGSTAPGTLFRTDYGTDLDTFELNRRLGWSSCLTFVHGFRWVHLNDQLRASQVAPVSRDLFSVEADNQMYGYQAGFDCLLYSRSNRFRIDARLRSAILYNDADATVRAPVLTGVPGFVDSLSASDDHTAFFGDLGFQGSYWLNSRFAVRAGYHLFWLEGVALAPPQIPINNLATPGTAAIDTGTGLFFNGASVGLMATW